MDVLPERERESIRVYNGSSVLKTTSDPSNQSMPFSKEIYIKGRRLNYNQKKINNKFELKTKI